MPWRRPDGGALKPIGKNRVEEVVGDDGHSSASLAKALDDGRQVGGERWFHLCDACGGRTSDQVDTAQVHRDECHRVPMRFEEGFGCLKLCQRGTARRCSVVAVVAPDCLAGGLVVAAQFDQLQTRDLLAQIGEQVVGISEPGCSGVPVGKGFAEGQVVDVTSACAPRIRTLAVRSERGCVNAAGVACTTTVALPTAKFPAAPPAARRPGQGETRVLQALGALWH